MESESLFARLTNNPARLRRRAYGAGVVIAIFNGMTAVDWPGFLPALLYPVSWLLLPVLAVAAGSGEAFFLQFGRGKRRIALLSIVGTLAALFACVLLATDASGDDGSTLEQLSEAVINAILVLGLLFALSALFSLALSKGLEYAGQRIQRLDDDHLWE